MLKKFKIVNLFGFRTVDIDFDSNIKILIGENGLGKTTVLNVLYYVLSNKYSKLSRIEFENIELEFANNKKIAFSKVELEDYLEYQKKRVRLPRRVLDDIDLPALLSFIEGKNATDKRDIYNAIEEYFNKNMAAHFAPMPFMVQELYKLVSQPDFENFHDFEKIIKELNFTILYFPTYRRVEEDLKNLGKFRKKIEHSQFDEDVYFEDIEEDIEISDDTLIHFGMEDVEERFRKIESEINKSTILGFSKVTGEMLSQLLEGFPEIDDNKIDKLDEKTVKLILHRVGNNLSKNDRDTIVQLLDNKSGLKAKKELVYFIYKLIDIYEQHKHLDDAVKAFVETSNRYLGDKNFCYDETSVDIKVYRNETQDDVRLNMLSSGEKQIVSLFSKIYLESNDNLVVLFDEPELSLSLEWQKNLLPDIVESNKCKFLLSVTHSPFIFKNELEDYAIGMSVYVSENC